MNSSARSILTVETRLLIFAVLLVAVVNAVGVGIQEYNLWKLSDLEILRDTTVTLLQRGILVSVIVGAVLVWFRRTIARVLLLITTLLALIGYLVWYLYSRSLINSLGSKLIPGTLYGLVSAKWWNVTVFFLLMLIAIWDIGILSSTSRAGEQLTSRGLSDSVVQLWRRRPALSTVTALLLLTMVGSLIAPTMRTQVGVFRSEKDVVLLTPDEGADIKVYQEFRWRSPASATAFVLTIDEMNAARNILRVTLQQSTYILTDKDAGGMKNGESYRWSVAARLGGEETRSPWRIFKFLGPAAGVSTFRDFGGSKRESIETSVANGDKRNLDQLSQTLTQYLTVHPNARTSDTAWALQTQGVILMLLDKHQEASNSYSRALQIWEDLGIPDALLYARCLTNYASVTQDVGDLDKSLSLYKRALVVLRAHDDDRFLTKRSTCLLNMGVLYRELGLARQAERSYGEALEIDRRLGDVDSVADELTNQANLIVSEFDDPQRGLPLLQEAAQLQRDAEKRFGQPRRTMADTLDSLAVAYSDLGDQQTAFENWDAALAIDRRGSNESGMLATTNNIANALLDEMHDNRGALVRYQDALKIIADKPDDNPDEAWRTYDGMSRVYQNLGDFQTAETYSLKAIQTIERMRKTVGERKYRRTFNAFRTGPFYGLALLRVRQGNYENAFSTIEAAKASGLREISTTSSSESSSPDRLTLSVLRESLRPEEVALEYLFGTKEDVGLLLAIFQNETTVFELSKRRILDSQIREAVKSFSGGARSKEGRQAITELTQAIIPPELWRKIDSNNVRNLLISPDGLLHNIPFDALARTSDGEQFDFLIRNYRVSIVPSFQSWERTRYEETVDAAAPDLLFIGDPAIGVEGCKNPPPMVEEILASRSGPELQPLPFSRQETKAVLKFATRDSLALTGDSAQVARFNGASPEKFKVIHFATHAISGGSLETSFLLFGCTHGLDGLTGSQVADLRLKKQLVVLSACDTDVGDTLFGEGNDSLASGFLIAGAACVVATRWRVRDDVPVSIMETYYDRLSRGDTSDEALRVAKLKYLAKDADPRNWAAFTSLGYGNITIPLTVSRAEAAHRYFEAHYLRMMLLLLAVIFAAGLSIFIYRRKGRRNLLPTNCSLC